MTIQMDWKQATFSAVDVIKLIIGLITAVFFFATMSNKLGNVSDDISDIRTTQVENSRKNDMRWSIIEAKQQQLELSQRLLEQRMDAIDRK